LYFYGTFKFKVMKQLIESIKQLTMAIYGAEISTRDIEYFHTIGEENTRLINLELERAFDEESELQAGN
jgi:hypothetical protein